MKIMKNKKGFTLLEILIYVSIMIFVVLTLNSHYFQITKILKPTPVEIVATVNFYIEKDILNSKDVSFVEDEGVVIITTKDDKNIIYKNKEKGFFRNNNRLTKEYIKIIDNCIQYENIKKCYIY